jgi:hypothetical protein
LTGLPNDGPSLILRPYKKSLEHGLLKQAAAIDAEKRIRAQIFESVK